MVRNKTVRPLGKIEAMGGRGKNQSFPIGRHRGRYLYIRIEDFEQLKKINEAYRSIYETGVCPLRDIKIVGRGGVAGYRPFLLRGYEGRYLCILEEHLRRLGEINAAYGEFLEVEKRREEEVRRRKLEERRKKELKEKKEQAKRELEEKKKDIEKGLEEAKKLIEEAKAASSLRYAPEMMNELEKTFADAGKAFDDAKYDKTLKLLPRIKGLAEQAKTETLKKVKEEEVRQRKLEEKRRENLEEKRKRTEKGLDGTEVLIEDVKAAGSLTYVPEMMEEMEKAFADARKAFDDAEYDRAFKLIPRIKGLAEQVKTEALEKVKEEKPEEGKYVYGIVPFADDGISFGNVGIENNGNVYAINYKDVAAVVSDASVKDYILTEDYIRTHEVVVRTVLKDYSVVPAAFGQVFKNQKILRAVMRNAYKELRECLKLVDDRVELGVKVILPKQVAESLDEQKKESFRKNGEEIFALLDRKAENSVKGRLFSDRLALNASFLVDKENIEEFSEKVGKLSEEYRDLKIKYSGPWPPYSFVAVRIGPKGVEIGRREVT